MHRMRRIAALAALTLIGSMLVAGSASAALIKPNADRTYPDVSADINGVVNYTYNASTGTGNFHLTNTPYLIAAGPTSSQEFGILPNSSDGIRQQVLNVSLDKDGKVLDSTTNAYALYGTVNVNGQIFSGQLLAGTPVAMGSQDLGGSGIQDSDVFDLSIKITGGALAPYFGNTAYMRLTPELKSTFTGRFDQDFSAAKATSNTRRDADAQPFPVPEPATLLLVLAGGCGLVHRHRKRMARS